MSDGIVDPTDHATLHSMPLTVVIFGATGDLAKKKLFPALYQLCLLGHLPRNINIVGYGRKMVVMADFLATQCANITEKPNLSRADFCARISFHAGGYDAPDSYEGLHVKIQEYEAGVPGNRLFFLSVPPTIFGAVCQMISMKAVAAPGGFTRLMIEKPFGKDSQSFEKLDSLTSSLFKSQQLFRLDHYLGKEVILNIATLRWANQIFEPVWSSEYIESVQLNFKEDLGTDGRGGYFDGFGIIRDIIQNHLLQAFMWLAMEPPTGMNAPAIVKAKVDLLSKVKTLALDATPKTVFLGQFGADPGGEHSGYLDDETVPKGSKCPTFASLLLEVDNPRWKGVPFLFTAGKGMAERVCEIRVRFKVSSLNQALFSRLEQNELVLRVQPDEALYMITVAKEPGITAEQIQKTAVMDMSYKDQFSFAYVGDAYERMILNAARGDQSLFVSGPELVEAWRIFTPLLHQIDAQKPEPVVHPFGSLPRGFVEFAEMHGVRWKSTWREYVALNGASVDRMKDLFHEFDRDRSGQLDFGEVQELAKRFFDGRKPPEAKVRKILKDLDSDGDGRVTLDELVSGAQSLTRCFLNHEEPPVSYCPDDV